ncbi:MAG: hypothetical protein ACYTBJ_02375 [Planctomycetota bacterium]
MALKIKDAPRALQAGTWEVWWPGDDAVEINDIQRWVKEGGKNGLSPANEGKPDTITVRKLEPDELDYISSVALKSGQTMISAVAFRIGCVEIDGMKFFREEVPGGIQLMARKFANSLREEKMEFEVEGQKKPLTQSLPEVIGAQILDASFPKG